MNIPSLRKAVREKPTDLTRRLVLADALEEAGDAEAAFQRLVVAFAEYVAKVTAWKAGCEKQPSLVAATDGRANVRVYHCRAVDEDSGSLYAWVRKKDGAVLRGDWAGPEGPIRFLLSETEKWEHHVTEFGLASLR